MNNSTILTISLIFNLLILFTFLPLTFNYIFLLTFSLILLSFLLIEILTTQNLEGRELQILEINQNKNMRCLKITMVNNNLLEGDELFKGIYKTLMNNKDFLKFGFQKIIILSVVLASDQEYNLHSNILINNNTTFKEYYSTISHELERYNNLQYGYHNELISRYQILTWNVDNKQNMLIKQTHNTLTTQKLNHKQTNIPSNVRNYSTNTTNKWFKGLITPISLFNKKGELKHPKKAFFTMDLETIYLDKIKGEITVAISSCGFNNGVLDNKIFLIDHNLLINDHELAVKELWLKYFNYLENLIKTEITIEDKLTIFAHNLGHFDGYFLYKGLMSCYHPDNITSLIDESNSFISISNNTIPILIEWKDSLRIFPMSLNKLCEMFGVEGKLTSYNPKFSSIELFNDSNLLQEFINYSLQDSKSLYQALYNAQLNYFDSFKVDIESIYSTATLSLKIYRSRFQEDPIFILPSKLDMFIRNSYFGGGTDVYKPYGENIHYYDVNSLYPAAMLNPMPYNLITNKLLDLRNRKLDTFFGFAYVEVFCPINMLRPVLPFHKDGKTIYPVGSWSGVYFSEELKAVVKLGYQINLINGYEFTKANLFDSYIKYFYEIKKNSTGVERNMAKLQLNNLYGYFGRKQIGLTTLNVKNTELNNILLSRVVKSLTPINNDYTTVLTYSNINYNLLAKLNNQFKSIGSDQHYIMSNVAIASAVTSYARIMMIPFKINPHTLYTDTDSAFTSKPIDPSLLGIELGMLKDELNGKVIKEAYFLGPKKYGYYLIDSSGNRQEFSVFAGVPRNSLTFEEVKSIFEGQVITKNISNRFYKSFTDLNITIKDTKISIKNTSTKELINNNYYPPKIHNGFHNVFETLFNKFKNLVIKTYKNFIKNIF
jgi:hypothetical protein